MEISVVRYKDDKYKEWDDFIDNSYNGTFLQSRLFLSYHQTGKFIDCSLMFYDKKNRLIALCPACEVCERGKKVFYSHQGSTYGGLVVVKDVLRFDKIDSLITYFENWLNNNGFEKCILKQQNPLMCNLHSDLLEFCLFYRGYKEYKELDIFVELDCIEQSEIMSSFSSMKRRHVRRCIQEGMSITQLSEEKDMRVFLRILSENLKKYGLKPYHTVSDLLELKRRFYNQIEYWGCVFEGEIVAVSMVFLFDKSECAHTHYLAADPQYNAFSPMTYIYYKMIDIYKNRGYKFLSWGITSEHNGVDVNRNLTNTKEEFGGKHNVVSIFEKTL